TSTWIDEITTVANLHSYKMHLDGKSSTSREKEGSTGVDIEVVDGMTVREKLSWLHDLYSTYLLDLANQIFGARYTVDSNITSSVNINILRGINARYEWHVDSNPLTGLLFVTSHDRHSGGELVFDNKGQEVKVLPQSGTFLLFDAR